MLDDLEFGSVWTNHFLSEKNSSQQSRRSTTTTATKVTSSPSSPSSSLAKRMNHTGAIFPFEIQRDSILVKEEKKVPLFIRIIRLNWGETFRAAVSFSDILRGLFSTLWKKAASAYFLLSGLSQSHVPASHSSALFTVLYSFYQKREECWRERERETLKFKVKYWLLRCSLLSSFFPLSLFLSLSLSLALSLLSFCLNLLPLRLDVASLSTLCPQTCSSLYPQMNLSLV